MKNDDKRAERMETGGRYFREDSREVSKEGRIAGYFAGACIGTLILFGPMIAREIYQSFTKEKPAACDSRARR
jgi:hypothetical protein